jgi:hypothetical protein
LENLAATLISHVLVNFMFCKDAWFVHAIAEDAGTSICPVLEVREQDTLFACCAISALPTPT